MTDPQKPVQPKGGKPKQVSEADFIAFKKGSLERERRLKKELVEAKQGLSQAQAELKIAVMDADDGDEVKSVKEHLLSLEKTIREQRVKLDGDVASFNEREREVRVKELSAEMGIDESQLLEAEDIEATALKLQNERLAEENAKLKEGGGIAPESVFEDSPGGAAKTQIKDMSDEAFDKHINQQREEALSKK